MDSPNFRRHLKTCFSISSSGISSLLFQDSKKIIIIITITITIIIIIIIIIIINPHSSCTS